MKQGTHKTIIRACGLSVAFAVATQAADIIIDGGFTDWSESYTVGVDPSGDVAVNDIVDYKKLWATCDGGDLYLSYQTDGNMNFVSHAWRYNVFIDADNDIGTGFTGSGASYGFGADYLLQGGTLYSFAGASQTIWNWSSMGLQSYDLSQNRVEVKIARSVLGLDSDFTVQLFLWGDNSSIGDDFSDDRSGMAFSGDAPSTDPRDFLVYYGGDFSSSNLDIIDDYGTVVLHTQGTTQLTPKIIAELKSRGVSNILAYLSVGEQHGTHLLTGDELGPVYMDESTGELVYATNGIASYYVDAVWNGSAYVHDGNADETVWGGMFVHPNEAWRTRIRSQKIGDNIGGWVNDIAGYEQLLGTRQSDTDENRTHNFGFDGLFLDTLDCGGPWEGAGYYPWFPEYLKNAVADIATNFPSKFLMANRGLFFYDPNQSNAQFDVRPYEYTLRPYISGLAFESYYIGSGGDIVLSWFNDNRNRYAPKINAEAGRPDGFTVFCIDYNVENTPAELSNQVYYAAIEQGWIDYIVPDSLGVIGPMISLPADTNAPVWDSTAGTGQTDPPDRIGIQNVTAGDASVVVEWDMARDQTAPVHYNIYYSTNSDFSADVVAISNVVPSMGEGYATDTVNNNAYQTTVTGLVNGVTHYFRIRAHDSTPQAYEESNTVTLSATPYTARYVSLSGSAQAPYVTWSTAANNIQNAIDVAVPGDTIYVGAGTYDSGTTVTPGYTLLNRIVINKAVTVKSVDGAEVTIIQGQGPVGTSAVRCAYLSPGTVLEGFTLSGGHTRGGTFSYWNTCAGGVLLDAGGTLNNCIIINNNAAHDAGGVYCYHGGTLNNCLVASNHGLWGGGVFCRDGGTLNNCTITGNSATYEGDGLRCYLGGTIKNTIIYYNDDENYLNGAGAWSYENCCATPALGGSNIDSLPSFVDWSTGDYHLAYASACIDAGLDLSSVISNDLDGVVRPIDGDFDQIADIDIGAYEYNPATFDADGDGSVDENEWIAGTGITDLNSFFQIEDIAILSVQPVVSWQSVLGRNYTVFYQTNLMSLSSEGWLTSSVVNVAGDGELYSVTNPVSGDSSVSQFYLLKVERP